MIFGLFGLSYSVPIPETMSELSALSPDSRPSFLPNGSNPRDDVYHDDNGCLPPLHGDPGSLQFLLIDASQSFSFSFSFIFST